MLDEFRGHHVLLLQGPNGFFFRNVARHLRSQSASVTKVNFNPGDVLFYSGEDALTFRGTLEDWPRYFEQIVRERSIDVVMLFGDCRVYHRIAIERARQLGVPVYVFEEGYVRPDFVTLELGGVNGHSRIPKDPAFYAGLAPTPLPKARPVGNTFRRAAWFSALYAVANTFFGWRYPNYRHHRDLNAFRQAFFWGRSGVRKAWHRIRDHRLDRLLRTGKMAPYYLVPLQVYLDSQIQHSQFASVAEFIELVVSSFAEHAPKDTYLILKHHPFDRPYSDYSKLLRRLAQQYNLGNRLIYSDVIHLPSALKGARGTVVINSTVGLSSIHHGTPLKCLGRAVYDFEGLTCQLPLDEFWTNPGRVDQSLYKKFRWWLQINNQLNGNVWSDLYPYDESKLLPVRSVADSFP